MAASDPQISAGHTANSFGFNFDVSLSTAITAERKPDAHAPVPAIPFLSGGPFVELASARMEVMIIGFKWRLP